MIKWWLLNTFFILSILNSYCHEIDKVYYKINETSNFIEVEADFSWAVRNALLEHQPKLKNATTLLEYENAFKNYVSQNFVIQNKNGETLLLQNATLIKNKNRHNHGNVYQFKFQKGIIATITNTLLFNIHPHQVNTHSIKINNKWHDYKTTHKTPTITIKRKNSKPYLWLLFLFIPFTYFVIVSKKQPS